MCQRKTHEHSGAWPTGRFWNTLDYPCSKEILLHLESHGMKKELQHQMGLLAFEMSKRVAPTCLYYYREAQALLRQGDGYVAGFVTCCQTDNRKSGSDVS